MCVSWLYQGYRYVDTSEVIRFSIQMQVGTISQLEQLCMHVLVLVCEFDFMLIATVVDIKDYFN